MLKKILSFLRFISIGILIIAGLLYLTLGIYHRDVEAFAPLLFPIFLLLLLIIAWLCDILSPYAYEIYTGIIKMVKQIFKSLLRFNFWHFLRLPSLSDLDALNKQLPTIWTRLCDLGTLIGRNKSGTEKILTIITNLETSANQNALNIAKLLIVIDKQQKIVKQNALDIENILVKIDELKTSIEQNASNIERKTVGLAKEHSSIWNVLKSDSQAFQESLQSKTGALLREIRELKGGIKAGVESNEKFQNLILDFQTKLQDYVDKSCHSQLEIEQICAHLMSSITVLIVDSMTSQMNAAESVLSSSEKNK